MAALALILMGLVSAAPAAVDNPLALAEAGSVECYDPNEAKKSCRSIGSYRRLGDNLYASTATVLVSPATFLTLETTTQVTVRNGAVCGVVKAEEIAAGKLHMAGLPVDAETARPLMAAILGSLTALIDKDVCTSYVRSGDELIAKVTVNGVYRANTDQRVKWIGPGDGYVVSP